MLKVRFLRNAIAVRLYAVFVNIALIVAEGSGITPFATTMRGMHTNTAHRVERVMLVEWYPSISQSFSNHRQD